MTTKAELRAAVRRRLDDVLAAELWDDATLDDAMADALARYGAFAPQEERSIVTVSDGAMSFTVTGLERGQAISRVIDPGSCVIEPFRADDSDEPGQGWRWWSGEIRLAKPARAGNWIVEWHQPRQLPATDAGVVPVLAGDDGAVSLIAAGSALRRRAVEEAKRGRARRGRTDATGKGVGGDRPLAGALARPACFLLHRGNEVSDADRIPARRQRRRPLITPDRLPPNHGSARRRFFTSSTHPDLLEPLGNGE